MLKSVNVSLDFRGFRQGMLAANASDQNLSKTKP